MPGRKRTALRIWSEYLGLRLGSAAVGMMPAGWIPATARAAGRLMYHLDGRHRRRALFNINLAMPELDRASAERLALRSMQNCLQTFLAMVVLPQSMECERLRPIMGVTPDAPPPPEPVTAPGRRIFVTGHVGNWELLAVGMGHMGVRMHSVARTLDNPRAEEWTIRQRRHFGVTMIDRNDLPRMHEIMTSGEALGFITDQNAGPRGAFVPFFRRLASAHRGPGALAVYYDAPVVCGYARHVGPGIECKMECTEEITPAEYNRHPDPIYYVAARIQRAIETIVRRWPEQYLWIHRRWKTRPPHEAEHRPMPDRLRKALWSLPWMTEDLMSDLAKPVPYLP